MNREVYSGPQEGAELYLTGIIINQNQPAPSKEEIQQAFEGLGTWYTSAPPSDARDEKALELARTLIFNFHNFTGQLLDTAANELSPESTVALGMIEEGKSPSDIIVALTGVPVW